MDALRLTGGCNCGAVRFEITEPLFNALLPLHALPAEGRNCASANAAVVPGSFRIVQGGSAVKHWRPPNGDEKWFCDECGSAIFTRDPDDHARTGVRLGAIDWDPGIRPEVRQFVAYGDRVSKTAVKTKRKGSSYARTRNARKWASAPRFPRVTGSQPVGHPRPRTEAR